MFIKCDCYDVYYNIESFDKIEMIVRWRCTYDVYLSLHERNSERALLMDERYSKQQRIYEIRFIRNKSAFFDERSIVLVKSFDNYNSLVEFVREVNKNKQYIPFNYN